MKNILSSASKIVFILLAVSACVAFFLGRLNEGNFMILAGAAFSFYFANKGETGKDGTAPPYAGK